MIAELKSNQIDAIEDQGTYRSQQRRLVFDGLRLDVITFTDKPTAYLLRGALITDKRWSIAAELRVGDLLDFAIAKLGRRGEKKGDTMSWSGDTDSIRLRTSGGVITEIIYECYTS